MSTKLQEKLKGNGEAEFKKFVVAVATASQPAGDAPSKKKFKRM